jgi:hypothetical protein
LAISQFPDPLDFCPREESSFGIPSFRFREIAALDMVPDQVAAHLKDSPEIRCANVGSAFGQTAPVQFSDGLFLRSLDLASDGESEVRNYVAS